MSTKNHGLNEKELKAYNFAFKKDTESALKDGIYNKIIERYTKNKRLFEFSDRFVWSGAVYVIPEMAGYILFFAMFYWLGNIVLKYGSVEKLFMFFMLLVLWRLNILIKYLSKVNKKLSQK